MYARFILTKVSIVCGRSSKFCLKACKETASGKKIEESAGKKGATNIWAIQ